jgi:hypothetical protein
MITYVYKKCEICGRPIHYRTVTKQSQYIGKTICEADFITKQVCKPCYAFYKCIRIITKKIVIEKSYYVKIEIKNLPTNNYIKMRIYDKDNVCEFLITRDFKQILTIDGFLDLMKNRRLKKEFSKQVCLNRELLKQIYVYIRKAINQSILFLGV